MNFEQAFTKLIEYVNGTNKSTHSRNCGRYVRRFGGGSFGQIAKCIFNICYSIKFAVIRMFCGWVYASGVCQGVLQRALHQVTERSSVVSTSSSKEAGRFMFGVWSGNWRKGWVGNVSKTLPKHKVRDIERCSNKGIWREMHVLFWSFPSFRVRLSPLRG